MEPSFDLKNYGGKPLPVIPIDKKLKQSFYKQPVRISQNRLMHNIGFHVYDFPRDQQDFINYAIQYFLCETETPIKLYINRPNHVYLEISLISSNRPSELRDEEQLEVQMIVFMLKLKEIFTSFFKNQLDWDRIVKESVNDERLLQQFKTEVIDQANKLYKSTRETKKSKK